MNALRSAPPGPTAVDPTPAAPRRPPRRGPFQRLARLLWQQPLWAIPFAIFFGTLFGASWEGYRRAFLVSLVFSYSIAFVLWVHVSWIAPRLGPPRYLGGRTPLWLEASLIGLSSLTGSYLAAAIVNLTLLPGFLASPRDFAITGLYSAAFSALFGAVIYARLFYGQSLARASAVERARAELAQAELRTLRAQVNPHFLFNALNTIASLVRTDPDAAEDTTTRLAELFRHALRASDREHRALAEELEFVRHYLAIEHARFGSRLAVEESIEPGLEAIPVPALLLQPLVENAVRHGIGARPEGGRVRLGARRDGDRLELLVEDDGPGMREVPAPGGNGFGLHSVRERLRAAGPPHALHIDSAPDRGTRIRITLPIAAATGGPHSPTPASTRPGGVS